MILSPCQNRRQVIHTVRQIDVIEATPDALRKYKAYEELLDGRRILVRAIRPGDKRALKDGFHRLSRESASFRFLQPKHDLTEKELVYFTEIDFDQHVALVAELMDGQILVGVGRYIVCETEPTRAAEIAFTVDEAHHGLGIATILLHHLAQIGRAADISEFRANVLADNRKMLEVLTRCGLRQSRSTARGVIDVRLFLR